MKPSNKPHLIITIGLPGAGKSFFAEHFAETFKAPFVSNDQLIALMQANKLEVANQDFIEKCSFNTLKEMMKTGQTIVYDGDTRTKKQRNALLDLSREFNYDPLFVWVQTDEMTSKKRAAKANDKHPVAVSQDEFDNHKKKFTQPAKKDRVVVISGKHNYASQLKIVLKNLVPAQTESGDLDIPPRRHLARDVIVK